MRNSQLRRRKRRGQLEIGDIGAAVGSAQPVLLLGEVVVADAGAVELAQRGLGRAEVAVSPWGLAMCSGRPSIQPRTSARRPPNSSGGAMPRPPATRQRAPLAREQVARQAEAPPRHLVDPAQHRLDVAGRRSEAAALDRRNTSRLSTTPFVQRPAISFGRVHERHSAATAAPPPAAGSPAIQRSRSASARAESARFFAKVLSVPRSRCAALVP